MKWLRNLKIAQKILLLISLSALFIAVVGFAGYYFTSKLTDDMGVLYKDKLIGMENIVLFRNNVNAIKANLYDMMLTKDKDRKNALYEDILLRRQQNNQYLEKYGKTHLGDYEKETLKKLKEAVQNYRATQKGALELTKANRNEEAYDYYLERESVFIAMNDATKDLSVKSVETAKELYQINLKNASNAQLAIVIVIFMAIVSSITFGMFIANMITRPISRVVDNLKEVAEGNLKVKDVEIHSEDETGVLGQELNKTVKKLFALVHQVSKSVEEMSAGSEEMSAAADQTAQGAQQVSTSITQLAAGAQEQAHSVSSSLESLNKMNAIIRIIAKNAESVAQMSDSTEHEAQEGFRRADSAINKINQIKNTAVRTSVTANSLGQLSSEIEQIVDLIKGIANQTNLLALNAAIEAARAGEHGKGFAVVADEVKKLATQSSEATDKITGMVHEIQTKTKEVVVEMDNGVKEIEDGVVTISEVGNALGNIVNSAANVKAQVKEVSQVSANLEKDSDNVVRLMENISSITEESAASSEEIASITQEQTASLEEINASSQALAKVAEGLQQQVSVFKI